MAFGVEIVGIKGADPLEHLPILFIHQVIVFAVTMRWIKRMIAQHVERLWRQVIFYDVINVFVVAPGQTDLIQPALLFVNAQPTLKAPLLSIRVVRKKLMEYNPIRPRAAYRKGISDHRPLWFAIQTKNLSQIMNQPGKDEPAWMPVVANLFRRLQQVVELGKVRVRITVVHQRV